MSNTGSKSDGAKVRFTLDLPGFELLISGDRKLVETLYHQIQSDVMPAIFPVQRSTQQAASFDRNPTAVTETPSSSQRNYTWIYGTTPYYSKVYAVDDGELQAGLLGPYIEPRLFRRIYVDRDDGDVFTALAGRQKTLWAEFTDQGRDRFQKD